MKLKEIYDKIDRVYPKRLSDEYVSAYGGRDNSGILLDTGKDITGAVFSLDFSRGAIETAVRKGYNLIVTHHPAIFFPISSIRTDDPLGARLVNALEHSLSVISMHLNMDCAAGGIDESLALAVGAKEIPAPNEPVENGGYGRIFEIEPVSYSTFTKNLMSVLRTKRAFSYGEDGMVHRVASFCGAGVDAGSIAAAKRGGAEVIVSADIKHNFICDALESGLRVVQLTHYASENYGFRKIYQSLEEKLGIPSVYHEDGAML